MELLRKLTYINSPSGNEEVVISSIKAEIENYVDEINIDPLGNLIAHKKGNGDKLMLSVTVDEVGLIALVINDYISVGKIGAVNTKALHASKIIFNNNQLGIITNTTSESVDISTDISDFKVKLLNDCKVNKLNTGDVANFEPHFEEFDESVCAKALSSRACCYSLIEVIKNITNSNFDLYFVFSVQGKIGSKGLKTAAYSINPDYAIHLTATDCNDNTGNKSELNDGSGVVLRIMDSSSICNKVIKDVIAKAADKLKLNLQYEIVKEYKGERNTVDTTSNGVISGTIAIPCRYINTANEVMNKQDIVDSIKILSEICVGEIK